MQTMTSQCTTSQPSSSSISRFCTVAALALLGVASQALAQTATASADDAGRFLVVYRSGQLPTGARAQANLSGARVAERHEQLGVLVVDHTSAAMRAQLAANPDVEMVVPDALMKAHALTTRVVFAAAAQATPDALYHSSQGWAVKQVGGVGADGTASAPKGPWNTTKGAGVRIAILDSGVDPNHPDIQPNLALNLSEVVKTALPSACDDGSPVDQQGHGTWTASLAAGALGANTGLVAGVAPQATILNIKVLERMPGTKTTADPTGCANGQASGLMSWILKGIEDAVANRADIISMSLGTLVDVSTGTGAGQVTVFNRATQLAANAGVLLIAAAGNDGYNLANKRYMELPAQSRGVLAIVASTNPACKENLKAGATCVAGPVSLPYYSNYGAPLNALAAPGGSYPAAGALTPDASMTAVTGWITGACSSGKSQTLSGAPVDAGHSYGCFNLGHAGYVQAMGTSASAPLVAGAAALLRAAHPTWNAAAVLAALRAGAQVSGTLTVPQVSVTGMLPAAK